MKIVAISDLHGNLPDIPECDVLLIGGDICPHFRSLYVGDVDDLTGQANWLATKFKDWLDKIPAKEVVATWGNHDFVGHRAKHIVPKLRWHMLNDEQVIIDGKKIYGSPWQPIFGGWAYNAEESDLKTIWSKIPDNTDIIVFHGPPKGFGDTAPALNDVGYENTGSISQLERIRFIRPKLCIFGHIHEGRGIWKDNDTILANVSILDGNYNMVHKPMEFEL